MDRVERIMRTAAHRAGQRVAEAQRAYTVGRALKFDGATARIVCRRHAERRRVTLDDSSRPDCFDADHPACRGCAEDITTGCVETW